MESHLISIMVFLPLLGAGLLALLPDFQQGEKSQPALGKWIALGSSLGATICAIILVISMRAGTAEPQLVESLPWIGSYAITYEMAIDGLNALAVLLVGLVFPVLIASEWNRDVGGRGMHALFLVLQCSFAGVACAQDLFLLFFFWALSALPFYFLIGIWGGQEREKAAFHYIVSSTLGNALVFAALILIYYSVDPHTFLIRELTGGKLVGKTFQLGQGQYPVTMLTFLLISAGLALRAPIWPLHGWFIRCSREAPVSVFVALCAATVPLATYVFIRICYSLFPDVLAVAAPFVVLVGALNLVMGGICAVSQKSLRTLLAYFCLSELGMILIGMGSLDPAGVVGSVYQQLALALGLAGFGLFSNLVAERTGDTAFYPDGGAGSPGRLGGIASRAPAMALIAGLVLASLMGFPGMGGFVGQALVLIGTFPSHPAVVVIAGGAMILAIYYLFTMYRCVFLGKPSSETESFADLRPRERGYLFPVVAALVFFGLYPKPLLDLVRPTVLQLLQTMR